jgi:hypothetical protein
MHSDDEFMMPVVSQIVAASKQSNRRLIDGIYVSNDEEERLIRTHWWCHQKK